MPNIADPTTMTISSTAADWVALADPAAPLPEPLKEGDLIPVDPPVIQYDYRLSVEAKATWTVGELNLGQITVIDPATAISEPPRSLSE